MVPLFIHTNFLTTIFINEIFQFNNAHNNAYLYAYDTTILFHSDSWAILNITNMYV